MNASNNLLSVTDGLKESIQENMRIGRFLIQTFSYFRIAGFFHFGEDMFFLGDNNMYLGHALLLLTALIME